MNQYVYSPMKAAHIHRDKKVYKTDRGQNYTQKKEEEENIYIHIYIYICEYCISQLRNTIDCCQY